MEKAKKIKIFIGLFYIIFIMFMIASTALSIIGTVRAIASPRSIQQPQIELSNLREIFIQPFASSLTSFISIKKTY